MSDNKSKLDNLMLQIQEIIDLEYEDNDYLQTAFNNLAIALDDIIA
jgi:hypothetical protein